MQPIILPVSFVDGSTNQINIFQPEKITDNTPLILIFPAMGVPSGYYEPLATELANNGIIGLTCDLRGHEKSSIRPSKSSDFGYQEMLDIDYRGIIKAVRKKFPNNKKYLLGHSLGGQLAALYLSSNTIKVDGLILIACCSVHYKGWKGLRGLGILGMTQFFRLLANVLGYFPGDKVGFGGVQAKTVIRDWSYQARTGLYDPENTAFDYEESLSNLSLPILACSFEGDNLAPREAVKNLYDKFSFDAPVQHLHFTARDLDMEKVDHYKWIRRPKGITKVLKDWIG